MMVLLGMRSIQAIGTSALYPAGIGMVRSYIDKNQNRVIATLAVFATTSAAFGPTISGLLIRVWRLACYLLCEFSCYHSFCSIDIKGYSEDQLQ